jgi:hypothetical protein
MDLLIYSDPPSLLSLAGTGLVCCSSFVVVYYEQQRGSGGGDGTGNGGSDTAAGASLPLAMEGKQGGRQQELAAGHWDSAGGEELAPAGSKLDRLGSGSDDAAAERAPLVGTGARREQRYPPA